MTKVKISYEISQEILEGNYILLKIKFILGTYSHLFLRLLWNRYQCAINARDKKIIIIISFTQKSCMEFSRIEMTSPDSSVCSFRRSLLDMASNFCRCGVMSWPHWLWISSLATRPEAVSQIFVVWSYNEFECLKKKKKKLLKYGFCKKLFR